MLAGRGYSLEMILVCEMRNCLLSVEVQKTALATCYHYRVMIASSFMESAIYVRCLIDKLVLIAGFD